MVFINPIITEFWQVHIYALACDMKERCICSMPSLNLLNLLNKIWFIL